VRPRGNVPSHKIKGTGAALVKVKKLTDAVGLVTTTGTGPDTNYIAVLHGAAGPVEFQMSIVISAKKGNGTVKPNFGPLVSLASGGSVAIKGFEVYTPVPNVGTNVADCTTVLTAAIPGVTLDPAPNPCATGTLVGVGGLTAGS